MISSLRLAPIPLAAVVSALFLAGAAVTFLVYPAYAQGGAEPLTGSFLAKTGPSNHKGDGQIFTIRIEFSEEIDASYKVLRDEALEVEGGAARKFKRVDGSSSLWEVHVEPDSDADVTLTLPETTDCAAADAVCTASNKPLSRSVTITIPGPVAEPTPTATPIPTPTATPEPEGGDVSAEPPGALASAVNDDASAIVLTWEAPSGCSPDTYAVYRRTISEDGSRLAKIATVGGAALSYRDANVTAGATYRYRVRSNDLGPRSGLTQIAMTESEPEPEPEPGKQTVRAIVLKDEVTLISNTGQPTASNYLLVGVLGTGKSSWALQFTAGRATNGYTITEVLVPVSIFYADAVPKVSIYTSASGLPGTLVFTFTNPDSLTRGLTTFTAPADSTLSGSDDYLVVFEQSTGTGVTSSYVIAATTSTSDDAGAATGWFLGDNLFYRPTDSSAWSDQGVNLIPKVAMKGTVIETTAPALSTAKVDVTSLVLTYDEALDEDSIPPPSVYSVTVGSNSAEAPSRVAINGSIVRLTLRPPAVVGDTVTLSYLPPATNPVQDAAGNDAAALSGQEVTNNSGLSLLSNWPNLPPSTGVIVGDNLPTLTRIQAQKFRTGTNPNGYVVTAVTFFVFSYSAANVAERVSIYTAGSDGTPAARLYLLTGVTGRISQSGGPEMFTAPAGALLHPNTDYFIYFEDIATYAPHGSYSVGSASHKLSDGLAGWSLGNNYYQANQEPWGESSSTIVVLIISGEVTVQSGARWGLERMDCRAW